MLPTIYFAIIGRFGTCLWHEGDGRKKVNAGSCLHGDGQGETIVYFESLEHRIKTTIERYAKGKLHG